MEVNSEWGGGGGKMGTYSGAGDAPGYTTADNVVETLLILTAIVGR